MVIARRGDAGVPLSVNSQTIRDDGQFAIRQVRPAPMASRLIVPQHSSRPGAPGKHAVDRRVEQMVRVVAEGLHRNRENDLQDVPLGVTGSQNGFDNLTANGVVLSFD